MLWAESALLKAFSPVIIIDVQYYSPLSIPPTLIIETQY